MQLQGVGCPAEEGGNQCEDAQNSSNKVYSVGFLFFFKPFSELGWNMLGVGERSALCLKNNSKILNFHMQTLYALSLFFI